MQKENKLCNTFTVTENIRKTYERQTGDSMSIAEELQKKVVQGYKITKEEAMMLAEQPLEELCTAADEIRKAFGGDDFDLCAVVSVKGGQCSENCRFCAQSTCAKVPVEHRTCQTEQ